MKKVTQSSLVWLGVLAMASMSSAFANTTPCQGQIVYGNNGNHLVGEVTALYGQKAEIHWMEMNGDTFTGDAAYWNVSDLSVETDCAGNICKGKTIYGNNGNHLVGKVIRTFENGKVEISWATMNGSAFSGSMAYWDASDLSPQTHCAANRVCEGSVVYGNNGNHLVGTVHRVFANGKVEIAWATMNGDTFSGDRSYWDATDLSKESGCSGAICENDQVYGSNGNNLVGTVHRIFQNGKAEILWTEMNGQPFSGSYNYWDVSDLQKRSGPCGDHACSR